MALLALGGATNCGFGRAKRAHDLRMVAAKAPDHRERRDPDPAQRETGIARERRFKHADRIARQPVIIGHRAIERAGGFGRAGEREALLVSGQGLVLSR